MVTGAAQVEVHAVLGGRGLGYPEEPHVRAAPARCLDVGAVACRLVVDIGAERCCPEPGERRASRQSKVTDLIMEGMNANYGVLATGAR